VTEITALVAPSPGAARASAKHPARAPRCGTRYLVGTRGSSSRGTKATPYQESSNGAIPGAPPPSSNKLQSLTWTAELPGSQPWPPSRAPWLSQCTLYTETPPDKLEQHDIVSFPSGSHLRFPHFRPPTSPCCHLRPPLPPPRAATSPLMRLHATPRTTCRRPLKLPRRVGDRTIVKARPNRGR